MYSKQKIISDTFYYGMNTFTVSILGYIFWVAMAKLLSVNNYGVLTMIFALYGLFLTFMTLNIQEVFGKMIPQYHAKNESNKISELLRFSFKIILKSTIVSIFIIAIIYMLATNLVSHMQEIVFWATILSVFGVFYIFLRGILFGHSLFKKIFIIDTISHGIKPLVAVMFVIYGLYLGGVFAWIITFLIASFIFFLHIKNIIFKNKPASDTLHDKKDIYDNISSSFISNISIFLILQSGTIILGIINISSAGLWGATIIIGQILLLFPSIIQGSILPTISSLVIKDFKKAEEVLNRSIKYILIILIPIAIAFTILSKQAILLLYKTEYLSIAGILPIYLSGIIFFSLAFIIFSTAFSAGLQRERSRYMIMSTIICVVLNLIFIIHMSILGAALSFLITSFMMFIFSLYILKKLNVKIQLDYFNKFLLIVLLMSITFHFISYYNSKPIWISASIFTAIFYIFLIYKLKIIDNIDLDVARFFIFKLKEKRNHFVKARSS